MSLSRRELLASALAIGAAPAFAGSRRPSRIAHKEAPERFPQGVASGDPQPDNVILWTRREPLDGEMNASLTLEVALDPEFKEVVATRRVKLSGESDWTCRVLAGGLAPATTYWYRFTDRSGSGSRVGRTRTAPAPGDGSKARFAFVSCQNINLGPLTAWRRMVFEDERAGPSEGIDFILHLGDFVYETLWLPEDRPNYFDRRPRAAFTYPDGERHEDTHVPVTLADYRTLYRAYLHNPDLQDARARWPFVAIWDNGEFSDKGWQSLQRFGGRTIPAQTRKLHANQAWFEFMPARAATSGGSLEAFAGPEVHDAPIDRFDENGLGLEPNNLAALASLTGYRSLRWGRHVDLILTDQRSYRSDDFSAKPEAKALASDTFPQLVPFETLEMIDAGRTWAGGQPSAKLQLAETEAPNFQNNSTPRTLLGAKQKKWFFDRLASSQATWKIWGNTLATFDMRADPQHLPEGLTRKWPGQGYAGFARTDYSTAYAERAEIFDFVRERGLTGFVTVSGDRHSFWAGYSSKALPPSDFEPVGINFVTGSISTPGMAEALEHILPAQHPLRPLYLLDSVNGGRPEPTVNLLLRHGVRTCLDYAANRNLAKAVALSDPGNAPHVAFVDMAGHGYGIVTAAADGLEVEFVCVERPLEDSGSPDGAKVRYRVAHRAEPWAAGESPKLVQTRLDGDAGVSA